MDMGEFFWHIKELPKGEWAHQIAWAALRGQFSAKELEPVFEAPAYAEARDFLADLKVRLEGGVTEGEMEHLMVGMDMVRCAPLMTDEELRTQYWEMYKLEYLQRHELDKRSWNLFVRDLFQALDPKGLTRRGLDKTGTFRARLGTIWTEEAALLVMRLNRIMEPSPSPRTPLALLAHVDDLRWAKDMSAFMGTYSNRALEHSVCPPCETDDTDERGAWPWRTLSCPLSIVKAFSGLEPRRRARIIRNIDMRWKMLEESEADRRTFVWEEDWDGRYDD